MRGRSSGQSTKPHVDVPETKSKPEEKGGSEERGGSEEVDELISFRNTNGKLTICSIPAKDCTSINVELIRQDIGTGVEIDGLVDSGATDQFVDEDYVQEQKLPRIKLERAIPVYNVDGTLNASGSITEKCAVTMRYQDHYESVQFFITRLGKKKLIVGHTWLRKHNPEIDWVTGKVRMARCPEECARKYPSERDEVVSGLNFGDDVAEFKIFNTQLGLWDTAETIPELYINAYTTKSTEIAAKNYVDKSFEEAVPSKYHKYKKVFEETPFQNIPPRRVWDHGIDLKPGIEPSKLTKAYPISPLEQTALDSFLDENLKSGRIRPSKSPWASGFFFVTKKDGKLRPVQDYRALNNATIKNAYPLPLISEMIPKLQKAKYFTKLDVRWGFNNIRIREGDEEKAAFLTNRGLFEPTVMFFGLCNSPATFQTMMNKILQIEIRGGCVLVYMDDVLIFTETLEEHELVTNQVLQVLEKMDCI